MWSNSRVRAAVDCGETDGAGVREEIVVGSACGGKPGSHGGKENYLKKNTENDSTNDQKP